MKIVAVISAAALVGGPVILAATPAEAGRTWAAVKCVPHAATPGTPAVDEKSHDVKVIDVEGHPATEGTPAVEEQSHMEKVIDVEATAEVWANWSPNHQHGPFVGPPAWPSDPRGTWHLHSHIPPGHAGADGVYERDHNGKKQDADWFYRHNATAEVSHDVKVIDVPGHPATNGTPAVEEVSHMEKVIDTPAKPATPGTPAVTCPGDPKPTPTPAPAPKPPVKHTPKPNVKTAPLPKTGADDWGLALTAFGLIGVGSVLIRKFN